MLNRSTALDGRPVRLQAHRLPSKGFVLGALAGGASRIQQALRATTDADLERAALVHHRTAGNTRVISIRDLVEIVERDIEAHFASIRAAMADAA